MPEDNGICPWGSYVLPGRQGATKTNHIDEGEGIMNADVWAYWVN